MLFGRERHCGRTIVGVFDCGMMQFLYRDHGWGRGGPGRGGREVGREVGSGGIGRLVGV